MRPELPEDVKKLIADFQKAREDFMAAQREELKKAKDATKEARAEARERLKDLRQNFVKQQIVNRKEIHDRLQEIKGKLRNDQSKPTGQATDGTRP